MPLYEFDKKQPQISSHTFIHPEAVIIGDVLIGEHCFIGPGAVIRADFGPVVLGDGVSLQDNAVIHVSPDSRVLIEDDVVIGHAALLHDVHIGPRCIIGMGAILMFNVMCEAGSIIGAGSVVTRDTRVPAGRIASGNPAKIVKTASPEQLETAVAGIRLYQELARTYLKTMKRIPDQV